MAWIRKLESGNWQACWRDPDRKLCTKSFGPKEKMKARQYGADQEADKRRGDYFDQAKGNETLNAFWDKFIEGARPHLRPSTIHQYKCLYRLHIAPALGSRRLATISKLDITNLIANLHARSVGVPSVAATLRLVKRTLSAAVEDGKIARNPATGFKNPEDRPAEMRFLEPGEIGQLLKTVPQEWRAFVLIAIYGGLRIGELVALRSSRINWQGRAVRVEEAYAEVGGRLELGPPKSGKKRSVTLPAWVMMELRTHISREGMGRDGLIFHGPENGPVFPSNFRHKIWYPTLDLAGLGRFRFHDLRHTSVALAISAGAHPKQIQARSGHSTIAMTLDRYGHLFEGLDSELAERLPRPDAAGLLLESSVEEIRPA